MRQNHFIYGVDKKIQLYATFCILYISSSSCSTCFGQPCAHHQELTTASCYSLVLVCAVAEGRLSRPVGRQCVHGRTNCQPVLLVSGGVVYSTAYCVACVRGFSVQYSVLCSLCQAMQCTVQYRVFTVQYSVTYKTLQENIMYFTLYSTLYCTAQLNIVNTILYCTIYSTLYCTAQYNIQYTIL